MIFEDIFAIENGAKFINVDLHVHSYGASADVKDASMTPEAIVESAVRQGIRVLSITDHNSDVNVGSAIAHANNLAAEILILPGVEVTTAHGHLLVYFDPDEADKLAKFIHRIDLTGRKGEENTRTSKSMADVIAEAYQLNGICVAAHIDREKTGFEKFAEGFQNWKRDIITSPGLYGIECDAVEALDWYSDNDVVAARRQIYQSRSTIEALKGRNRLAYIQGSDSHTLAAFESPNPNKPWTRMKMTELSWGAFRTAIIDPTARVRAQAVVPKAIPRIRGISVTGGFLDGEAIHFSDNLNCFIGGRGTGKSTAIRTLAYAFGENEEFANFGNCPDSMTVFCEDVHGTRYRYERDRGGEISVSAKTGKAITQVPSDAFRIEYFGQGELAEVAKDPLNTPSLFQQFLDRHTDLNDLIQEESQIVAQLRKNAVILQELEVESAQLKGLRKSFADVNAKLRIAEEGKLREIVGLQSRITAEKTAAETLNGIIQEYREGHDFIHLARTFDSIVNEDDVLTEDEVSKSVFEEIRSLLDAAKTGLREQAALINSALRAKASELTQRLTRLKLNHARLDKEIAAKVAALRAKGLDGNITELEHLIRQKVTTSRSIAQIEQRAPELRKVREDRRNLMMRLEENRLNSLKRRKQQLKHINRNLALAIPDYTVFVHYDSEGIIDSFLAFILEKMSGTYFQEQAAKLLCSRLTPQVLADLVYNRAAEKIAELATISEEWGRQICEKLAYWRIIHELQILTKEPKPIITVRTKSVPYKAIPVIHLSDGQRHTILLTIALLAESNIPLIIDQPEDDLDNEFIVSSIVATLRSIKERRQVILITHNANIAVLGDAELLLPMKREDDCGKIVERGSIDREDTKLAVQKILEGGPEAFSRRRAIYGY